jgi:peptide/nickel transport system substrate-binding protein
MKRIWIVWVAVCVLLALMISPVIAQDAPGPGEGTPIVLANLGSDIATLNPILVNDGSSATMTNFLFPALIGVDVDTSNFSPASPTARGSIATAWEVSEDGLTYTFTLRDDWTWSDGTPITAADYKYGFDAIASGETETALVYVLDTIASVEAPDATTLVITINEPDCSALSNINAVPVVPAHVYSAEFAAFADMNSAGDFNLNPAVTAGRFSFANFRPGEQVTLVANQAYPDAEQYGYVVPEGLVFKNVADENLILEQFLAGEITVGSAPEDRQNELRDLATNGEAQISEVPATSLRFISFNQADPANPQSAFAEDGTPIDQGHHPILGDVRVRQALHYATNWAELNEKALGNEGIQLASPVLPTSWAFDASLEPYPFDLAEADRLLTEAGWIDDDSDPATPRVAQGALYAEDGTLLSFKMETNAGNAGSEAIGVLLQAQWGAAGVEVDFQMIDFNILVENLTGQTFDAVMLFWGYSIPDNPEDLRANYHPDNDVVGAGFNVTSYNNAEFNSLMDEAKTFAGCDQAGRQALYAQVQSILREDVPWMWVNSSLIVSAVPANLQNFQPRTTTLSWNNDAWFLAP